MKEQCLKSAKAARVRNNILIRILLAVLAVIWVFPVLWVIMTSFRAEKGSYISTFFPHTFTLANYTKLFTDTVILNFPRMFMNTLIISIFSCIMTTFFQLFASFCLSRMRL